MSAQENETESLWRDRFFALRDSLAKAKFSDPKKRRLLFVAAEKELAREQAGAAPEDAEYHRRVFRTVWRFLESDIRAGKDIFQTSYVPEGLEEAADRLRAARELRRERRRAPEQRRGPRGRRHAPTQEQLKLAAHLKRGLAAIDMAAPGHAAHPARGLFELQALLIMQFQVISSESRFAILWMLVAPAVLLALISLVYFLIQTSYIFNMDVPTFALIGSCTWIMLRQTAFRVSGSLVSNRAVINLPPVRPFDAAITMAVLYLIIYTAVLLLLFAAGAAAHIVSVIEGNALLFTVYFLGMWAFGVGMGFLFGGIAVHAPFFLRFAAVIERALQLFSSVFFVSEQLPESFRPYVMWCPTAHGMQLLRAAYFPGYVSADASPAYFWISVAVMLALGLAVAKAALPNIKPV